MRLVKLVAPVLALVVFAGPLVAGIDPPDTSPGSVGALIVELLKRNPGQNFAIPHGQDT